MRRLVPTTLLSPASLLALLVPLTLQATVRYVNLNSPGPSSPYTSWTTAATNIQDAIDAADAGDQILVTNGVYATGGKVMAGDLTNRVALDKPITVQSLNGPWFTTIRGNGATNGNAAVRCAWVTNGAVLSGFTLTAGATRSTGDSTNLQSGGAALCVSSNALISNCLIISNTANAGGGGVYQGNVINSALTGNRTTSGAAAAAYAALLNCTITTNLGSFSVYFSRLTNCIHYYTADSVPPGTIYSYCCRYPLPTGQGNFTNAPQLLGDFIHLASTSPCRGTGTNLSTGTDIDGQAWNNPPSVGCDDWQATPAVVGAPTIRFGNDPSSFAVNVFAVGQEPFTCYWTRNGSDVVDDVNFSSSQTTNLIVRGINPADAGAFQVVVSNSFGCVTSVVAQLTVRYVDVGNPSPQRPYRSWTTAATNIQDAIETAADGDVVIVTNGTYATGGKVMSGDLANRIALDKAIRVQSVNGPWVTTILGAGATNSATAVRCAWLTNGASLVGFTITGGATRPLGSAETSTGGGVWCSSSNAFVSNCLITTNTAYALGGGIYLGTVANTLILGNAGASANVGAAYGTALLNCTVVSNTVRGVVNGMVTNGICYYNSSANSSAATFSFSCTTPLPAGTGNFTNTPRFFLDTVRLDNGSPCIGAGTNLAVGTDLFGLTWANPPSVGCAEWQQSPLLGTQPKVQLTSSPIGFGISFVVAGESPLVCFWTRDDNPVEDDGHYSSTHTTNLVATGLRYADAGNYQVVASNAFGMVTSAVATVVIHCVDAAGTSPAPPYLTWATAATNIQDAIDVALGGEIVLVTNGVYVTGSKISGMTNRVYLDKPLTVSSVNGYTTTVIQGAWDPATTNGLLAVRCAALVDGALLNGFTLRNGATLASGDQYGGGFYGPSANAIVSNCLFTNNAARFGGAVAYGTVLNSLLLGNIAAEQGGGVFFATARNCTIVNNSCGSPSSGGGAYNSTVRNSIVVDNYRGSSAFFENYNYFSTFSYSCSFPTPSGTGNTGVTPAFLNVMRHLPAVSPLRGVGSSLYSSGVDADGETWANPPSMGWDEVVDANLTGPLAVTGITQYFAANLPNRLIGFAGWITGRASRCEWNFGDGAILTNASYQTSHAWTNPGDYTLTFTAFNNDYPSGVSTNLLLHIDAFVQPTLQFPVIINESFRFSFNAQTVANYTIQYATNLVPPITWKTLQTIYYSPGGPTQISDSAWTNAARFYRVLVQ